MKFDRLNLLRIYAFLIVFLLHAKLFIPVDWSENVSMSWILYTPAWAGVWFFFILSGYGIGCGFYSGKYEMSVKGIFKYYYLRLIKIIPVYWIYIFLVIIFFKPEYLLPQKEVLYRMLSLLLFNYQEEFDPMEFGLAWYLTTLMRLYFVSPIFYYLKKRYLNLGSWFKRWFFFIWIGGMLFRITLGYYIFITGEGEWSDYVYKPFYCNFDLYFLGFTLNELKREKKKLKSIKVIPWIGLILIVIANSYIYYYGECFGENIMNMNFYRYIMPSIYLPYICFMIYNYDIVTEWEKGKGEKGIINFIAGMMLPLYLFHSTVLLCMQKVFMKSWYMKIIGTLRIPNRYMNFSIGLIFTILSLFYTMILAVVISYFVMPPLNKKLDQLCHKLYYRGRQFYVQKFIQKK